MVYSFYIYANILVKFCFYFPFYSGEPKKILREEYPEILKRYADLLNWDAWLYDGVDSFYSYRNDFQGSRVIPWSKGPIRVSFVL